MDMHAIDEALEVARRIAQSLGQERIGKVLVAHRAHKAVDGQRPDGCRSTVGRGGERASVDHRVSDLDARWPTVRDDAAGFALQGGNQASRKRMVVLTHVHRSRQLALQRIDDLDQGIRIRDADEERSRAE